MSEPSWGSGGMERHSHRVCTTGTPSYKLDKARAYGKIADQLFEAYPAGVRRLGHEHVGTSGMTEPRREA